MIGKLPPKLLTELVLRDAVISDQSVILGPQVGEDAAVIDLGDGRVLVTHSDSISAAYELIGWLSINVVANDVAVTGARPKWFLISLMIPSEAGYESVKAVMDGVSEAANSLRASVVGGHTEFTRAVRKPLTVSTGIGITSRERFVRTSGARNGDLVLMTKYAGLEGTAILATDFRELLISKGVNEEVVEAGRSLYRDISVVSEALKLSENGYVNSMHDPTEGGILGGLTEIAYASRKTIRVNAERVPIHEATKEFCRALGIDPLKLISSGVLLASVPKHLIDDAVEELKGIGIQASVIGEVIDYQGYLVELSGRGGREVIDEVIQEDELINIANESLQNS